MRSGPPSTSDDLESPAAESTASPPEPTSRSDRVRRWLLDYGLSVETAIAALLLVSILLTTVVVLVGAITALPTGPPPEGGDPGGEGSILGVGTTLINGTVLVGVGLGLVLLLHGVAEAWTLLRGERGLDLRDGVDLAYVFVRSVQTITAAAFAGPIVVGVTLSSLGLIGDAPPDGMLIVLLISGLSMLASVLVHAVGRTVVALAGR